VGFRVSGLGFGGCLRVPSPSGREAPSAPPTTDAAARVASCVGSVKSWLERLLMRLTSRDKYPGCRVRYSGVKG
jgi:hypothetical protein